MDELTGEMNGSRLWTRKCSISPFHLLRMPREVRGASSEAGWQKHPQEGRGWRECQRGIGRFKGLRGVSGD